MKQRFAFSLIESIIVIVVIGILAAMIIPRAERDMVHEAAEQLLSHIKYTQHLALNDNSYNDSVNNWHFARWHISFIEHGTCGLFYRVGSNRDRSLTAGGNPNSSFSVIEAAVDPLTNYPIYNDALNCGTDNPWYNDVLMTEKYGIQNSGFDMNSCNSKTLAFDRMGRPHFGFSVGDPQGKLIKVPCNIVLEDGNGNGATITVTPESGYAFITYN